MRQIKFRAKRLDNGEWVYGDLLQICGGYIIYYGSQTESDEFEDDVKTAISLYKNEVSPVHPDTVGQFTGLTDSTSKEIYEGDIVRWKNKLYAVKFWCGMFYASVHEFNKKILGGFPLHALTTNANKGEKCLIIGNIHDNSELVDNEQSKS